MPRMRRTTRTIRTTRTSASPIGVPLVTALVLAVLLLLPGCSAVLRVGDDAPDRDRDGSTATARVSVDGDGAIAVVRIPAARPADGVQVVPDEGRAFRVPPGHYPPPGACRIWDPGVPPGRQPPPGDCDELERRVPPGSYLIVG